jgi:hypothetical protein
MQNACVYISIYIYACTQNSAWNVCETTPVFDLNEQTQLSPQWHAAVKGKIITIFNYDMNVYGCESNVTYRKRIR